MTHVLSYLWFFHSWKEQQYIAHRFYLLGKIAQNTWIPARTEIVNVSTLRFSVLFRASYE